MVVVRAKVAIMVNDSGRESFGAQCKGKVLGFEERSDGCTMMAEWCGPTSRARPVPMALGSHGD